MVIQQKKRLAYLIHTFPLYSLTFIVDEIVMMRDLGVQIDLFGVRKPSAESYPASYDCYAKETSYVLPIRLVKHLYNHLQALYVNPQGYFWGVKFILTAPKMSLRQKVKLFSYFSEAVELNVFVTPERYAHLHVHFMSAGALVAIFLKKLNGMPFSITGHGTDFMVERVLLKEKVHHADFVRVATRFGNQLLAKSIQASDRDKIFQLPFGIDVSVLKAQKKQIYARINMPRQTTINILNVGRLVWQKGQCFLIEAAKILHENGVDFTINIIGEGELRTELEALIEKYGLDQKVVLHGALPQKDVFKKMKSADIFAFSSVSEGFGIVLLEAMASGLAIVASDINGVPEIITKDVSGLLFESKNAQCLAENLGLLCCDEALSKRLALRAFEDVIERFDNQILVENLYSKIIECSK